MINFASFLFLGTLGWGISLYLIKVLLVNLTPIEIVLYRMAIGAITLFLLAKVLQLRVINFKHLLIDGAVLGIFNMTVPFYLTTFAEQSVSSSLASVINGLTPIFTLLIGVGLFSTKQKFNIFNTASIFLGLLGILIVNFDFTLSHGRAIDILALVVTGISYGMAANYVRSYAKTKEPILVAAMAAAVSTIIMLMFKLCTQESSHWGMPDNGVQILSLLWLGSIGSGICLYLYCFLIQRIGAVTASMMTYLMTVTGVASGMLFLNEKMTHTTFIGCACIVASLVLVNHSSQLQNLWRIVSLKQSAKTL